MNIGVYISFPISFSYFQIGGASGEEPSSLCRRHKSCRFHPWLRKSPGRGNDDPFQYSCLENPIDRGAWWARVHRVTKGQTQLKWLSMHSIRKSEIAGSDDSSTFSFFKKLPRCFTQRMQQFIVPPQCIRAPLLWKSFSVQLRSICLFLLVYLLPWDIDLEKYCYDVCLRMFCLCSLLGVL